MHSKEDLRTRRLLDKFSHKDDPPVAWGVLFSEAVAAVILISLFILLR